METSPDSQFYFERLATPRLIGVQKAEDGVTNFENDGSLVNPS